MKICFFGVGGVGGYYGALVSEKFGNEHEIYFIARGKHKTAIQQGGLVLKKSGGEEIINVIPTKCTDNIEEIPVCDIVIVSVKGYDLAQAAIDIDKISNESTLILPLLNGVDIYIRLRSQINKGFVFPSCVYIGTHIESPGVIFQIGGNCKICLGKDPQYPEFYPTALLNILRDSNIDYSWEENVEVSIWEKFMFIAAYGLVTAVKDKTIGEVLEDKESSEAVKSIMKEIKTIADVKNIPLEQDIVEKAFIKATQFPFEIKTSFQRDVESKGKTNEGDLFGGTIIRLGKELNIPTSNTEKIYNEVLMKFE